METKQPPHTKTGHPDIPLDGVLIYLNPNPDLDRAIAQIEKAGGKLLLPKTKNPAGLVCIFVDTEGNKMGLFAGD